jgi:hypothetical protein
MEDNTTVENHQLTEGQLSKVTGGMFPVVARGATLHEFTPGQQILNKLDSRDYWNKLVLKDTKNAGANTSIAEKLNQQAKNMFAEQQGALSPRSTTKIQDRITNYQPNSPASLK